MADEIQSVDTVQPTEAAPVAATEPAKTETFNETLERVARQVTERGPGRDEASGKFTPKAGAVAATPEADVPGNPTVAAPEPALPAIEAPQSLPDDVKKVWNELPRTAQEAWSRRESESHKKITSDGERLKSLSPFEDISKSIETRLRQLNAPAPEYFRRLSVADQIIASEGLQGLERIAREAYGIDLRAAFGQPGAQPAPTTATDPRISKLETRLQQMEREAEESRTKAGLQIINDFKKDKPYFDEALPLMNSLMEGGQAKDLPSAYDMAINASPEIRAKRDADAKAEADKKAAAEAKEKQAKDAKLAALGKRPGSTPTAPMKGKNIWDTMDRVAKEVTSRAN